MIMETFNEKQISLCHSERIKNLVGLLGLDFILFRIYQKHICHPELVSGSLIEQISHKTNMFYLRC